MVDRNLRSTAALVTLLFLTEAMCMPHVKATKRQMKSMVRDVLKELYNKSTGILVEATAVPTIRCLAELQNNTSDCEIIAGFSDHLHEAVNLDILWLETERLQAIDQYLLSIQQYLCTSRPAVKKCEKVFEENDGDYEKFCKVISFLELLKEWLSR